MKSILGKILSVAPMVIVLPFAAYVTKQSYETIGQQEQYSTIQLLLDEREGMAASDRRLISDEEKAALVGSGFQHVRGKEIFVLSEDEDGVPRFLCTPRGGLAYYLAQVEYDHELGFKVIGHAESARDGNVADIVDGVNVFTDLMQQICSDKPEEGV